MEYANYIARCIEIARRGEYYVAPNPMVGAVLVRNSDDEIMAEGWHEKYGEAHAEVNCFKNYEKTEYRIQNTKYRPFSMHAFRFSRALQSLWEDAALCETDNRERRW